MAQILPFRAYRYTGKAGDPNRLVTQPYDKISPEAQQAYYEASDYNIIRLIKGKSEASDGESSNVYTRAAATLDEWIASGILAREDSPSLYPYFQEFSHPDNGDPFIRQGFITLLKLEDYSAGVVHPHELTHRGPKLDRLELVRHTRTHFGQLFLLYDDPTGEVDAILERAAAQPSIISVRDEMGTGHKVWRIADQERIGQIQEVLTSAKLLIADGHHRYETALAYAEENRDVPGAGYVMVTLVNLHAPGLAVLATHRVLHDLEDFAVSRLLAKAESHFDVAEALSVEEIEHQLTGAPQDKQMIGVVTDRGAGVHLLTAKPAAVAERLKDVPDQQRALDVVLLHKILLEDALGLSEEDIRELRHIRYVRGIKAAAGAVQEGLSQVAFLLRPVRPGQVAEVAFAGGVMPQKSTDFYPKLLAGLTMYRIGEA